MEYPDSVRRVMPGGSRPLLFTDGPLTSGPSVFPCNALLSGGRSCSAESLACHRVGGFLEQALLVTTLARGPERQPYSADDVVLHGPQGGGGPR